MIAETFHKGNRQPLEQWVDVRIANRGNSYFPPESISNDSYMLGNYEDHIHWFAVRVEQRDHLGWFMDFRHWNPDYWDKLREWALSEPNKIRERLELIDTHRALVDRVTEKMVL